MNDLLAALILEDRIAIVANASGRRALRWTPPGADPDHWLILIPIAGFRRQLPRDECEGRWSLVSEDAVSQDDLTAAFSDEELAWAAGVMAHELRLSAERAALKAEDQAALRAIALERQDDGKLWARVSFDPTGRTQRFMAEAGAWWKFTEGVWAFSERRSEGALVDIRRWAASEGRGTSYIQR